MEDTLYNELKECLTKADLRNPCNTDIWDNYKEFQSYLQEEVHNLELLLEETQNKEQLLQDLAAINQNLLNLEKVKALFEEEVEILYSPKHTREQEKCDHELSQQVYSKAKSAKQNGINQFIMNQFRDSGFMLFEIGNRKLQKKQEE